MKYKIVSEKKFMALFLVHIKIKEREIRARDEYILKYIKIKINFGSVKKKMR